MSGLVVKHFISEIFFLDSILKPTSQPKDLPIQFFCIIFTLFGQLSSVLRFSNRFSENFLILKNHWLNFFLSTIAPDLHPLPSITCSLASTV